MYNANRLANSARKAEREGRTFEANSLWGQVATKAESVVVRHPKSKYAEEATILRGPGAGAPGPVRAGAWPARPGRRWPRSDGSHRGCLAGDWPVPGIPGQHRGRRCGLCPGASTARIPWRRREARFHRARTLRHAGRYQEALRMLEGVPEPSRHPLSVCFPWRGTDGCPRRWPWQTRWWLEATRPSPGTPSS